MTHEGFVLRSLRQRRLGTALSALAVALGVALVYAVDTLRREARAHFEGSVGAWDLVVGPAKGEPLRIVLGAIFHLGEAQATLPEDVLLRLRADPRVSRAVPLAVGDSFRGFRVVGTSADLFGSEVRRGAVVRVREGAPFPAPAGTEPAWEAVLGSTAAAGTGLRVGDAFVASHGLDSRVEGREHAEAPWRVAGILEPTGTPVDRLILIPLEAFWRMEGHDPSASKAGAGGAPAPRQVSYVLVRTTGGFAPTALFHELRASPDAQPARPFLEVRALFDLLGNYDRLLLALAALVVVVAALGILVSMTNSMRERRRDIALLRALGARRRVVAGLLVGEAATVGAFGALLGLVLGHGLAAAGGERLAAWTGVPLRAPLLSPSDVLLLAGAVALCALAGLLPAVMAYREDVAEGLAPES